MSVAKAKSVKGAQAPLNVLEGVAAELGARVEGSQPVNSSELMPGLDELLDAELVEGIQGESEVRSVPIGAALHGERVDRALAELVPEFSRSYLQQLLGQGLVALAQQIAQVRAAGLAPGRIGQHDQVRNGHGRRDGLGRAGVEFVVQQGALRVLRWVGGHRQG